VKRSLLVEGDGGPLAAVVAAANVPDFKLLAATLGAVVVPRPRATARRPQHLCLDKGYDNDAGWGVVLEHDYEPHIAQIRDARRPRPKRYPAHRWVVERTLAWLSKCRALLIRYDKRSANYLGLIQLACALLWYRRLSASRFAPIARSRIPGQRSCRDDAGVAGTHAQEAAWCERSPGSRRPGSSVDARAGSGDPLRRPGDAGGARGSAGGIPAGRGAG